jgi:SPP1 family predicted phage head-tail adaptor
MNAGDLRHRIVIQEKITTAEDSTEGIARESWVDLITTWAEVSSLGGKETFNIQAIQGENSYMFKMRYKKNIDKTMRIVFLGENYNIIDINDVNERHKEIWVTCNKEIENG